MGKSDKKAPPRPTATTQSPAPTAGPPMLSVKIPVETEKKLLSFVSSHLCDGVENDPQRVTRVRLQNQYAQMIDAGFTHEHVAAAMKATLGGGIGAALDYLCLTLPHEQLPLKFTDKSYEEEMTGVTAVVNSASVDKSISTQTAAVARDNYVSSTVITSAAGQQQQQQPSAAEMAAKADADREERRRWIARYESAQSDDDDDDDDLIMPSGIRRDMPKSRKEVTAAYTALTDKLQAMLIAARQSKSSK